MGKSCCVVGCVAKDVTYFRFPNSRTRCKRWMEAIKLASKPSDKSMVCSAHFHPDDYNLVRGKVRLKPKVVPCVFEELTFNLQSEQPKTKQANFRPCDNINNSDGPEHRTQCDSFNDDVSNNKGDTASNKKKKTKEKQTNRTAEDVKTCTGKTKLSESVTETVKPSLNPDVTITEKDDIEDILTYFNIKQNKQVVERQNAELQEDKNRQQSARAIGEKRDDNCVIDLASIETEAKPVFIEIATDQEQPNGTGSGSDCLMVLESVQVDLDPNELMLPEKGVEIEEDEEDMIVICDKPDDPISLLTSSDEDDVIIQEPRIETVEVSDETDEDDVPLVKLIKTKSKKKKKKRLNPFSRKNTWGDYLYNCMDCQYRSDSKLEYEEHVTTHSTLIYMCHICEYITASKVLFTNHQKKHKEDKRYECHLCGYKARHKLSLTYHMKSHNSVSDGVGSDSEIPKSDSDSTKRRGSRRKKPK